MRLRQVLKNVWIFCCILKIEAVLSLDRSGSKMSNRESVDRLVHDSMWCLFVGRSLTVFFRALDYSRGSSRNPGTAA